MGLHYSTSKSLLMTALVFVTLATGCAKSNDNTQSSGTVFINRGSALYNTQVTPNMGIQASLAVDPQYASQFEQTIRGFYSADGQTQIPGGIDPLTGVTFVMMPINFNPQNYQAVINPSSPPMMTIYVRAAGGQQYALSMRAIGGQVMGQTFTLAYADDFRTITLYGSCGGSGVQGPVGFQITRGVSAGGGEQLLGYFSMPGYNNYCGFF